MPAHDPFRSLADWPRNDRYAAKAVMNGCDCYGRVRPTPADQATQHDWPLFLKAATEMREGSVFLAKVRCEISTAVGDCGRRSIAMARLTHMQLPKRAEKGELIRIRVKLAAGTNMS